MILFNIFFQPFGLIFLSLVFFVSLVPLCIILLPLKRRIRFKYLSYCWKFTFFVLIKLTTFGRDYKEDRRSKEIQEQISPPGLYIANHQSFMDIPLISNSLVIAPIMKKSLLYIPILGFCFYASGAIIVNRKKKGSRKKALFLAQKRLQHDEKNMMYYPEGGRNRKSSSPKDFSEIKTPLLRFAYQNKIKVYPVSMYGTDKMVKKKMIQYGKKIGIILHAGISPENFESEDLFIQTAWKFVQDGHAELAEKLTNA